MVKIRLKRLGRKKKPFYRIVVADNRSPRDGKAIDEIGTYNPLMDPPAINLDMEKVDEWINKGAKPTKTVAGIIDRQRELQNSLNESKTVEAAETDILDDQGANTAEGLAFDMVDEAENLEAQGE